MGTVVHRILQHHDHWPGETTWIEDLLIEEGVQKAELGKAVLRVRTALQAMSEDPRGRWLLDPGHREQRKEYALSGRVGGVLHHVVIDRSFVDAEGLRWVIDYKTSHHAGGDVEDFLDREQERYRLQMLRYATLMQALTGEKAHAALYFPLLQGWREYPRW